MHPRAIGHHQARRHVRAAVVVLALSGAIALVAFAQSGCDDVPAPAGPRRSQKHESCQITNDCAEGLSCAPLPGGAISVCVTGDFRVRPT